MGKAARRAAAKNQSDQRFAAFGAKRIVIDRLCFNGVCNNGFGVNGGSPNIDDAHLILVVRAIAFGLDFRCAGSGGGKS
jgi:hypothetical protein